MSTLDIHMPAGGGEVVAVHGIAKHFGSRVAVQQLSMALFTGQVFGLIGANGSGKTTTLRMLAGLLTPDAGSGTVLGYDLLQAGRRIRERVGYVSQAFSLYPTLSVFENLRFRAEIFAVERPRRAVEQIMEEFGLQGLRNRRADRLSGGWSRLLQLAAALIHRPRLVLLDEPTAGLDAENRQAVWRRIMLLANAGASVVLSTHDLAAAERCAHVAILSRGIVQAAGTTQDLIDRAPAVALLARGERALSLADPLSRLGEVIATYPQGRDLRILVDPGALEHILHLIGNLACRHVKTALNFEDAALVLSRAPAGTIA